MQASVMVAGCPAYIGNSGSVRCGLPAEAEGRHTMRSADRPLHSARIRSGLRVQRAGGRQQLVHP
jgi:hypothetical protein